MGFSFNQNKSSVAMDDGDKNNSDKFIGFVEVCIHQARDIHNICIYQNQDVYAKFCPTDDPESKISTKVVNRGGRNPVFNETLKLGFQKSDSSLRCEIWMLSRIKNYLEDQFLGFASVPFSDVVSDSGNLPREYELSSSELFHSHAGFVELSFNYSGIASFKSQSSVANVAHEQNISCDLDRIEFPDQENVSGNEKMVSEYLSFPCNELDSGVSGVSCPLENDDNRSSKEGSCPLSYTEVHSLENPEEEKQDDHKSGGGGEDGGGGVLGTLPVVDVRVEKENTVVQEEIVDLYMKGMQQFTDALAKMKLPMDIGDGLRVEKDESKKEDDQSGSNGKIRRSKSPDRSSPRVFYGSGAFF